MAVEMKYGDYIKGGVDLFKVNLVPSIVAMICMCIPIFGIQVSVNYLRGLKEAKASGKAIEIGSLFAMDNIVNNIITMIICFLFAMCCGLPFALVYFGPALCADHPGVGFMDIVKGALAFGKQNLVPSLILMIILSIVGGIGGVVVVGSLITYPIAMGAMWCAYEDHKAAIHAAAAESGVTLS
jgi:hypothetical protein